MDVRCEFYITKKNLYDASVPYLKFDLKMFGDGRQWNRQWFQVEPEMEVVI